MGSQESDYRYNSITKAKTFSKSGFHSLKFVNSVVGNKQLLSFYRLVNMFSLVLDEVSDQTFFRGSGNSCPKLPVCFLLMDEKLP